jgi:putative ABC transport system substrate-binding protein
MSTRATAICGRRAVLRTAPLVFLPWLRPLAALARDRPARVGFLGSTYASRWMTRVEAFRAGLRELGYVEGKDLTIEYRWAEEDYDRLSPLATELLRLPVDVIVTYGTPATLIAKKATREVPIVMAARSPGAPTSCPS